ncbi:lectin [Pilimelia terevasa]|uniref:lectin n=1 Tax=Pilimelia terevasa TaxID=53372 RepID=UPI00166BF084|nr:lectin [Pilimelia terevasa]
MVLGVVAALGGTAIAGSASAGTAATAQDRLHRGEELKKDQELRSAGGRHRLVMQGDGNFVLYRRDGAREVARWATGTARPNPGEVTASFAAVDDNLQVTHGVRVVWREDVPGASVLVLQSDGNVVAYTSRGVAVWATNTVDRRDAGTTPRR